MSDRSMILVVNADGKYWDGLGWNQQGKEFFSVAKAMRSLHEEGESWEEVKFLDKDQ